MIAQENTPSTPEDKVVHCAINWRRTEKAAIAAPVNEQPNAQRQHYRAKMSLREAVDALLRRQP
jgi:hypothetical protein